MKLTIYCDDLRKDELPILSDFLEEHFIYSFSHIFKDDSNAQIMDKIERGLSFSNHILCLVGETLPPWLYFFYGTRLCTSSFWLLDSKDIGVLDIYSLKKMYFSDNQSTLFSNILLLKEEVLRETNINLAKQYLAPTVSLKSFEAFIEAVEKDDRFLVGIFLEAGYEINKRSLMGVTPLGLATRRGNQKLVEILLEAGADINLISTDRNNSPLMDAASEGNLFLLNKFISKGASIEQKSKSGQTALILAVGNNKKECARVLIEQGADCDIKDSLGLSAKKYATLYSFHDLLALMEKQEDERYGG